MIDAFLNLFPTWFRLIIILVWVNILFLNTFLFLKKNKQTKPWEMAVFIKLVMMSTIPLRSDLQVRFFEVLLSLYLIKVMYFR